VPSIEGIHEVGHYIRALYWLKLVISPWAMLMESMMFCIDVEMETQEGSLVFLNPSLKILSSFKYPWSSSSMFSGVHHQIVRLIGGLFHWFLQRDHLYFPLWYMGGICNAEFI